MPLSLILQTIEHGHEAGNANGAQWWRWRSGPELETDVYTGNPAVCHGTYLGHLLWRKGRKLTMDTRHLEYLHSDITHAVFKKKKN